MDELMTRPRRLRAQPPDAAHPRGAREPLSRLSRPQPHLGSARGHHQAPSRCRRHRAERIRAGGEPHARGAARRLRGRDRLQQPRHRRRPRVRHDRRRRADERRPVSRCARRRSRHCASRTSASSATRSCVVSSTAAREDLLHTTLANIERERVASVADVRRGGQAARRLFARDGGARQGAEGRSCTTTSTAISASCAWATRRGASCATCSHRSSASRRSCRRSYQARIAVDGLHRAVCDYIAGMTDRFALDEHRKLFDPLVRV